MLTNDDFLQIIQDTFPDAVFHETTQYQAFRVENIKGKLQNFIEINSLKNGFKITLLSRALTTQELSIFNKKPKSYGWSLDAEKRVTTKEELQTVLPLIKKSYSFLKSVQPMEEVYRQFKQFLENFVQQVNINMDGESGRKTRLDGADKNYPHLTIDNTPYKIELHNTGHYGPKSGNGSIKLPYFGYQCNSRDNSWINVRTIFSDFRVSSFKLVEWYPDKDDFDLNFTYPLDKLDLFSDVPPNQSLKDFYDTFISFKRDSNMIYNLNNKKIYNYIDSLKSSKNLILRGAPGTGKTYLARQIAAKMIDCSLEDLEHSEQFGFVQFHPNYDYTDFVEGLRPVKTDNDSIAFERRNGIFMDFCEKAKTSLPSLEGFRSYLIKSDISKVKVQQYVTHIQYLLREKEYSGEKHIEIIQFNSLTDIVKNSEQIRVFDRENDFHNYFLTPVNYLQEYFREEGNRKFIFVIDEINRGDMAKIFGELFFSLDPGYRGKTGAVTTQFANLYDGSEGKVQGDKFYIPENVYIIGTMNDIDRSVDSFDFAMRRRFRFIEITAESQLGMFNSVKEFKTEHIEEAKRRLQNLNQKISKTDELNANYHIGPSYFLNLKEINYDYEILWSDYLEPLLAEYLRGTYEEKQKLEKLRQAYDGYTGEEDVDQG